MSKLHFSLKISIKLLYFNVFLFISLELNSQDVQQYKDKVSYYGYYWIGIVEASIAE